MIIQTRTRALLTIPLLILASCSGDFIGVDSKNEPSNDVAALRLIGITTPPLPTVVFRAFQGGLDDNMRVVIRFPKAQLSSFWASSPWRDAEKKELFPRKPGASLLDQPSLSDGPEPEWQRWQNSGHGVFSKTDLANARYVEIYVALDQEDEDAVGYIFWSET
jgi:hypothetical protein